MTAIYNRIAAHDVGRIAALSDGIFAFAMTVLVLEIHTPDKAAIGTDAELLAALAALAPALLTWLMSLMTLGIFWVGQQTQINHLQRADRTLSWLHFLFLAIITVLPFSTRLLATFIGLRTALIVYWLNILLAGVSLLWCWSHAQRAGLTRADAPDGLDRAIRRRILVAQALYLAGAMVGLVSPIWGIGCIVVIQLNYALAPRLPLLSKL